MNNYEMSLLHHPDKDNVVVNTLCRMPMDSVAHVEEGEKDIVKYVHRFTSLGVRLEDSPKGDVMVHHNSESLFVV